MNRLETLALVEAYDALNGRAQIILQTAYRDAFAHLWEKVGNKPWRITWEKYYRRRTTGRHSQNHRINGFIQQICAATGNTFGPMKEYCKELALSRGYPFETLPNGKAMPKSEADLTTIEAALLIDTIEQVASDLGIHLKESYDEEMSEVRA